MCMTSKIARLLGALCMGALVACASDAAPDVDTAQPAQPLGMDMGLVRDAHLNNKLDVKQSELTYHDAWRRLWEDHITWTRMVIIGVLDCLDGNDVYTARLLKNYEDMEDALMPYYERDDVEALGDLIKDHLTIAASILVAARDGDTEQMNALIVTWRANGDALAKQMNAMNPKFWPFESTAAMWQEHVDVTLAEATAHLTGDFQGEVAVWEKVHTGGLMMADLFSRGTMRVNPSAFVGCKVP